MPPQGGKGGGRPMQPKYPQQPGQVPPQGGKAPPPPGVQMPIGLPPSQPGFPQRDFGYGNQLPPQGGKGGAPSNVPNYAQPYVNALTPQVQQLAPGQVPAQGGKGTSQQDYDRFLATSKPVAGGSLPSYEQFVQNRLNQPQVMPQKPDIDSYAGTKYAGTGGPGAPMQPQVPPQGGKAPLTPEQQAALGPYINNRPMPQVSPPQGGFPQQPYFGNTGGPLVKPMPFPAQPQVMPRPVPQVMPRQPTPKPAPQGLAGLQNMLYGGRR
jgi:hypothetical protein